MLQFYSDHNQILPIISKIYLTLNHVIELLSSQKKVTDYYKKCIIRLRLVNNGIYKWCRL